MADDDEVVVLGGLDGDRAAADVDGADDRDGTACGTATAAATARAEAATGSSRLGSFMDFS